MDPTIQHVLSHYDLPDLVRIESLGSAGGFSGAQLWKISTNTQPYCLRRWPHGRPDLETLDWIHLVLRHARTNDCDFVATPIDTRHSGSSVQHASTVWELSKWVPGQADFSENPSNARLENMMQALARFHLSAAQVSLDFRPSKNLQTRIQQLNNVMSVLNSIDQIRQSPVAEELAQLLQATKPTGIESAQKLIAELNQFANATLPVQPVIRDVWHDHVLFTGEEVTGLVDFGAMQMDSVALDISRLLGTTIAENADRWPTAIDAYTSMRPLSKTETDLIPILDRSGILLGAVNWLKWICLENRTFENPDLVSQRIQFLSTRLKTLW